MTPNVLSLIANSVSNFVTVVVPARRWAWYRIEISHHLTIDKINEYRDRFRRELSRHGEGRCLDSIEMDKLGNWRIHFFPLNKEVILILENAASVRISERVARPSYSQEVSAIAFRPEMRPNARHSPILPVPWYM